MWICPNGDAPYVVHTIKHEFELNLLDVYQEGVQLHIMSGGVRRRRVCHQSGFPV